MELTVHENLDRLTQLADELVSGFALFERIDKKTVANVTDQIVNRRNYQRWQPLNPRYAEWKRRRYGNRPILVLTGSLLNRYRNAGAATDERYSYGLTDEVALKHQRGIGVPQRAIDYTFFAPMVRAEFEGYIAEIVKRWSSQ